MRHSSLSLFCISISQWIDTYTENFFLEQNGCRNVGLELGLGGCGFPTEELITWCLLDQVLLAVDDIVVLVCSVLVDLGAVDEEV